MNKNLIFAFCVTIPSSILLIKLFDGKVYLFVLLSFTINYSVKTLFTTVSNFFGNVPRSLVGHLERTDLTSVWRSQFRHILVISQLEFISWLTEVLLLLLIGLSLFISTRFSSKLRPLWETGCNNSKQVRQQQYCSLPRTLTEITSEDDGIVCTKNIISRTPHSWKSLKQFIYHSNLQDK